MWPRLNCQRGRSALHISKTRSTSRHDFASAVHDTTASGPPCRINSEGGVVAVAPAYVHCGQPALRPWTVRHTRAQDANTRSWEAYQELV
jgi:hypothetical protein